MSSLEKSEAYPVIQRPSSTIPDFIGTYKDTALRHFSMYILEKGLYLPSPKDRYPKIQTIGNVTSKIEGLIIDEIGLAVYSGSLIQESSISFTKTYSKAARTSGHIRAFKEIEYTGEYNRATRGYEGEYFVSGSSISGPFILKPLG